MKSLLVALTLGLLISEPLSWADPKNCTRTTLENVSGEIRSESASQLARIERGVRDELAGQRTHWTQNRFDGRTTWRPRNGQMTLRNDRPIPAQAIAVLETTPASNATIRGIEVIDSNGRVLGSIESEMASGLRTFNVPINPPTRIRIHFNNGSPPLDWTSGAHRPAPPSLRYSIPLSDRFTERGFSGGHSQRAWDELNVIYEDQLQVRSVMHCEFGIPEENGSVRTIQTDVYRYAFRDITVQAPKTIFRGALSEQNIQALENFAAPYIARTIQGMPNADDVINLQLPVRNSQGVPTELSIRVVLRRTPTASSPSIAAWWINPTRRLAIEAP